MKRLLRIRVRDRWYNVEVDDSTSPPSVWVDGEPIEIEVEEQPGARPVARPAPPRREPPARPAPGPTPGLRGITPASAQNAVLAPMAGRIVSVSVKVGDSVSAGDEVCIMETMKMEQSIRTSRAGVAKSVPVAPGQNVATGQMLVEFE